MLTTNNSENWDLKCQKSKMTDFCQRTEQLIGCESYQKIKNSVILIVGVGGVGGYAAEFFARAGVGNLVLVDFDKVENSNINRQIIATSKTVGEFKTEVLKQRLLEINPDISVRIFTQRFNEESAEKILGEKFDFVVDAIDSVKDKTSLILFAKRAGFKVISAMGAGNRFDIPSFDVKDIFKTQNDGLAKAMRKNLREAGVSELPCVCAKSQAIKLSGVVGSISYYPPACASVICAYVLNEIIKG